MRESEGHEEVVLLSVWVAEVVVGLEESVTDTMQTRASYWVLMLGLKRGQLEAPGMMSRR